MSITKHQIARQAEIDAMVPQWIKLYTEEGKTALDIGIQFHVADTVVARRLRKAGIPKIMRVKSDSYRHTTQRRDKR